MNINDSQHLERYEQMKIDVDRREVDWYFFRDSASIISADMQDILTVLQQQFLTVGPFGEVFVKDTKDSFRRDIYNVPLQHCFKGEAINAFSGIGFFATNDDATIRMKTIFDYFRQRTSQEEIAQLDIAAVCVQSAFDNENRRMVFSVECIEGLQPLAYYEHPTNNRFIEAMIGNTTLDQSFLALHGKQRSLIIDHQTALFSLSAQYNNYDLGLAEQDDLRQSVYNLFY